MRCKSLSAHARLSTVDAVRALQMVLVSNSSHMIAIDNDRQQLLRETLEFAAAVSYRIS